MARYTSRLEKRLEVQRVKRSYKQPVFRQVVRLLNILRQSVYPQQAQGNIHQGILRFTNIQALGNHQNVRTL